jgi:hypothetical protein
MNTSALTAQNCSLFVIDTELEAAFDQMQEEREITGNISDESRQHCVQLFAELGKKVIASRHTCEPSNTKPALPPRKRSGYNNAAGQPSSGSTR